MPPVCRQCLRVVVERSATFGGYCRTCNADRWLVKARRLLLMVRVRIEGGNYHGALALLAEANGLLAAAEQQLVYVTTTP